MDWKHALDLQHDACKFYSSDHGINEGASFFANLYDQFFEEDDVPSEIISSLSLIHRQLVSCLYQADTMFVTSDMIHLAMQAGHDLPPGTAFHMESLLSARGFVLLEENIVGEDRVGNTVVINAFAWEKALMASPYGNLPVAAVNLYFFTDPYEVHDSVSSYWDNHNIPTPPLALSHFFPLSDGYVPIDRDEQGSKLVTEMLRFFISLMHLSHQTIGEPIQLRPDRAARKRAQREWNMHDPLITVITLRRKSVKNDEEEPGKVEWSRRWLVRGHWAWRACGPGKLERKLVYIYEYVKGPEDKPFIPPSGRVFNFRR